MDLSCFAKLRWMCSSYILPICLSRFPCDLLGTWRVTFSMRCGVQNWWGEGACAEHLCAILRWVLRNGNKRVHGSRLIKWCRTRNCPNGVRQGPACIVRIFEPRHAHLQRFASKWCLRWSGLRDEIIWQQQVFGHVEDRGQSAHDYGQSSGGSTGCIFCFRSYPSRKTAQLDDVFAECSVTLVGRVQSFGCASDNPLWWSVRLLWTNW